MSSPVLSGCKRLAGARELKPEIHNRDLALARVAEHRITAERPLPSSRTSANSSVPSGAAWNKRRCPGRGPGPLPRAIFPEPFGIVLARPLFGRANPRRHIHNLGTQRFFCAFRHFAQRVFWAARMRAIAAADMVRFLRVGVVDSALGPLTLAQRARCAAAIRARPAADIPPLRRTALALTPFNAEIALLRMPSCVVRRLRSC
jgi:hypothetical protein